MKDFKVAAGLSLTVFKHSRFPPLPELQDWLTMGTGGERPSLDLGDQR